MKGARFQGRRVQKPWGYELIWAETERYVGKLLHIERGEALSYQYHRVKDETISVLRGTVELEFAEPQGRRRKIRLRCGDCFRIPPRLRHRLVAVESSDVLEASTPEQGDVVRLEDWYGRAGTGETVKAGSSGRGGRRQS